MRTAPNEHRNDFFHTVGCGYHIFAGKECARALALMSLKPEDCNSDITDLDESKIKILDDWQKVRSLLMDDKTSPPASPKDCFLLLRASLHP